jgi:hypothetical protein
MVLFYPKTIQIAVKSFVEIHSAVDGNFLLVLRLQMKYIID